MYDGTFQNKLNNYLSDWNVLVLILIEDDSDSARENTELSNDENREDIDVESHGYESPAQRSWRERMEYYKSGVGFR